MATPALVAAGAGLFALVDVTQRAIQRDGSASSPTPAAPETVWFELAVYVAASIGLMAVALALAWRCHRGLIGGRQVLLILAAPLVVGAGLLAHPPALSTDVLSYVAQGSMPGAIPGATPYTHPAYLWLTPFGRELLAMGWVVPWNASPYGPLWTAIELLVVRLPVDVTGQIFAFKAIQLAAVAASAAVIWQILARVRPGDRLTGTVLFLWNPVVIIELAGEGHNDGLMVLLVLIGLLATIRGAARTSVLFGSAAALTKYLPIVLVPPQLVLLWRAAPDRRALARDVALSGVVAGGLAGVLVAAGGTLDIFEGTRYQASAQPWPTLPGGAIALLLRFDVDARGAATVATGLLLVALVAWGSWRVRDAEGLLRSLALIACGYALFISTRFYAWYAILPIALLALLPGRSAVAVIAVLTLASRFTAPLVDLRRDAYPFVEAWIVVTFAGTLVGALALVLAFTPVGPIVLRWTSGRQFARTVHGRAAARRSGR